MLQVKLLLLLIDTNGLKLIIMGFMGKIGDTRTIMELLLLPMLGCNLHIYQDWCGI